MVEIPGQYRFWVFVGKLRANLRVRPEVPDRIEHGPSDDGLAGEFQYVACGPIEWRGHRERYAVAPAITEGVITRKFRIRSAVSCAERRRAPARRSPRWNSRAARGHRPHPARTEAA